MEFLQSTEFSLWIIVKIAILIFLLVYAIFSFVIVRQARLMTETLDVDFNKIINTVAFGHLIASITIFVVSLIFL